MEGLELVVGSCHVPDSKDTGSAQPLSPPSLCSPPHDDSRWVFGHLALEGRQIPHVFIVEPLHLEVQVHDIKDVYIYIYMGFPDGSEVKASAWNAGDPGSIPGSGRSPGEGNGNPLQYSCISAF